MFLYQMVANEEIFLFDYIRNISFLIIYLTANPSWKKSRALLFAIAVYSENENDTHDMVTKNCYLKSYNTMEVVASTKLEGCFM